MLRQLSFALFRDRNVVLMRGTLPLGSKFYVVLSLAWLFAAYCSALHCTALHYSALLCIAVYCTALH